MVKSKEPDNKKTVDNSPKRERISSTNRNKSTKHKASKNAKRKRSLKRSCLIWFLEFCVLCVVILVIWGVYLDKQIRDRIDGPVWQLPVAIYGQIINLEPHEQYNQKEMVMLLEGAQYRAVKQISRPGEFIIGKDSIEMLRRPFDFPDASEPQYRAKLYFNGNELTRIQNLDTGRDFGYFRIDPKLITMLQSPDGQQRLFLPLSAMPDLLKTTLIATEDRRFYEHDGISIYSIGRAVFANIVAGRTVQGGSTLTQQLVKNLFLSNERSLKRKIQEAYMALILDNRYSKDRILELYLNEVYLGQSGNSEIRGFPLASLYYFGRPLNELSLDQQALLVGMVKGASYYNPWRYPERALARRNVVLKLLETQNVINTDLYNMLSVRPLGVLDKPDVLSPQPDFMDIVRNELNGIIHEKISDLSGMKVFTTFDPISQMAAEKAVVNGVRDLEKQRKLSNLEASMLVVNRFNGEIKAVVGGADPQFAGFNRVLYARRSIGSLIKPSTYLAALSMRDRYRLNTKLDDSPLSVDIPGQDKPWTPQNFDRKFRGEVTLLEALTDSLNVPAVRVGMDVGLGSTGRLLQDLGVPKSLIEPYPSRFLGAIGLTPLEVAQFYQSIASGGMHSKLSTIRFVMDGFGHTVYQSYPSAYQVASPQATYLTLYGMQQVVNSGSGRSLGRIFKNAHLAGKTGTTNDLRDSWFAGIDGRDVTITWVGKDKHESVHLTGSVGALRLYEDYLRYNPPLPLELEPPEGIQMMGIDEKSDFVCDPDKAIDHIPVWTDDPQALCRSSESWLQRLFH